ncbi:hypothetical protein AVEN_30870-1, partial [Araneus ventricosus]
MLKLKLNGIDNIVYLCLTERRSMPSCLMPSQQPNRLDEMGRLCLTDRRSMPLCLMPSQQPNRLDGHGTPVPDRRIAAELTGANIWHR